MDHTITAWKVSQPLFNDAADTHTAQFNVDNHSDEKLYECKGHKGPVEDIALNKTFDMVR